MKTEYITKQQVYDLLKGWNDDMMMTFTVSTEKGESIGEYVFKIVGVLYIEKTGKLICKPEFVGEVVRCQHCKHRINEEHNVRCKKFYGMGGYDEFCSFGEKE